MDRHYFLTLTTSSQWLLFLAVSMILYARVENREKLFQGGQVLLIILGLFSSWILWSHQIVVPDTVAGGGEAPPEARALTFFSGMIVLAVTGIAGIFFGRKRLKVQKILTVVQFLIGLFFFFMVYHLQKMKM